MPCCELPCRTCHPPQILMGASSSSRLGWLMKISFAVRHSCRICSRVASHGRGVRCASPRSLQPTGGSRPAAHSRPLHPRCTSDSDSATTLPGRPFLASRRRSIMSSRSVSSCSRPRERALRLEVGPTACAPPCPLPAAPAPRPASSTPPPAASSGSRRSRGHSNSSFHRPGCGTGGEAACGPALVPSAHHSCRASGGWGMAARAVHSAALTIGKLQLLLGIHLVRLSADEANGGIAERGNG